MAKEKSSTNTGRGRTRNFATVVYQESAKEDWRDKLSSAFVPSFISPLHDKDINPGGEPKKPHWHVLIMFDNVKTVEQAKAIFDSIGGVGCEVVQSIRGYARYLCHLDNPEKAQYSPEDIISLCGADYSGVCSLVIDKYKAIKEMRQFCVDNGIYSYAKLFDYCAENRFDWFRVLCDNGTVVIKEYLKSRDWETKRQYLKVSVESDEETGEVKTDEK